MHTQLVINIDVGNTASQFSSERQDHGVLSSVFGIQWVVSYPLLAAFCLSLYRLSVEDSSGREYTLYKISKGPELSRVVGYGSVIR